MLNWMFQHDCLDTYCFWVSYMHAFSIFVFAPVQRNWACFTQKSALEIHSLLLLLLLLNQNFHKDSETNSSYRQHMEKMRVTILTVLITLRNLQRLQVPHNLVLHCLWLTLASVCIIRVRIPWRHHMVSQGQLGSGHDLGLCPQGGVVMYSRFVSYATQHDAVQLCVVVKQAVIQLQSHQAENSVIQRWWHIHSNMHTIIHM